MYLFYQKSIIFIKNLNKLYKSKYDPHGEIYFTFIATWFFFNYRLSKKQMLNFQIIVKTWISLSFNSIFQFIFKI